MNIEWRKLGVHGLLLASIAALSSCAPLHSSNAKRGNAPGSSHAVYRPLKLNSIAAQPSSGLLFGVRGHTVFTSSDLGATWAVRAELDKRQSPNCPINLMSIAFLDKAQAWASGECAVTVRTRDEGRTWTVVNTGGRSQESLTKLMFVLPSEGMMVRYDDGTDGQLAPSIDGNAIGMSRELFYTLNEAHTWESFECEGCVVAAMGAIGPTGGYALMTEGNGSVGSLSGFGDESQASALNEPLPQVGNALTLRGGILPSRSGWVLGGDQKIYWIDLKQADWSPGIPVTGLRKNERTLDAIFVAQGWGVLIGTKKTLLTTSNRGTDWNNAGRYRLNRFLFADGNTVIAVTKSGAVMTSSDRGANWIEAALTGDQSE